MFRPSVEIQLEWFGWGRMVKTFQAYLPQCHRTYSCIHCRAHLANHDELISKSFQGSQGRAYLFNSVVNVGCGPAEERVLLTGLHAVADIYCECCKTTLGWKYEHAFESSQKYKEGKYIIELAHMIKENGWDNQLAERERATRKTKVFTCGLQCKTPILPIFHLLKSLFVTKVLPEAAIRLTRQDVLHNYTQS